LLERAPVARGTTAQRGRKKARRAASAWACRTPGDCFIQQAVEGLSIGLLLIDPRGKVVWVNRAAERLLGTSLDDCVGRSFKQVLRDPQLTEFWQESACREGNCIADVSVRWPRRIELKLNATQCIARDGREIGRALLFCDVTSDRSVKMELTNEVANRLLDLAGAAGEPPKAVARLTPQELRALRQVGRGLTNEAISEKLGVAVSTVRSHLKSVYRKLGLHTRAGAVSFAVQHRVC
jgi:PAS domain S-box-containing protein